MLDLETMGIGEKAAILEISLVPFCMDGTPVDVEPFHKTIDLTSCLLEGMKVEEDTQRWWMKQDILHVSFLGRYLYPTNMK